MEGPANCSTSSLFQPYRTPITRSAALTLDAMASEAGTSSSSSSSTADNQASKPHTTSRPPDSRFARAQARFHRTRTYRAYGFVSKNRRSLFFGASLLYLGTVYTSSALHARKRDKVHDSTYLYWKIYDGSIVEAKSSATALGSLLMAGGGGGSDEPPRVMTLYEVVRGLNWAMRDDRIVRSLAGSLQFTWILDVINTFAMLV